MQKSVVSLSCWFLPRSQLAANVFLQRLTFKTVSKNHVTTFPSKCNVCILFHTVVSDLQKCPFSVPLLLVVSKLCTFLCLHPNCYQPDEFMKKGFFKWTWETQHKRGQRSPWETFISGGGGGKLFKSESAITQVCLLLYNRSRDLNMMARA